MLYNYHVTTLEESIWYKKRDVLEFITQLEFNSSGNSAAQNVVIIIDG